jgi:hypothetical protein
MQYQRSTLRHRVVPPSMRYHPTPSHWRFLNESPWWMICVAASVLVLLAIGVLLAVHD